MLSKVSKTENKETLLNEAIEAVNNCLDVMTCITDITDEVYSLLGEYTHPDTTHQYEDACVDLLAALADPDISKLVERNMGSFSYGNLVEMLARMRRFCQIMKYETSEALLTAHRLKNYSDPLSTEGLQRIIKEYIIKEEQLRKMKAA